MVHFTILFVRMYTVHAEFMCFRSLARMLSAHTSVCLHCSLFICTFFMCVHVQYSFYTCDQRLPDSACTCLSTRTHSHQHTYMYVHTSYTHPYVHAHTFTPTHIHVCTHQVLNTEDDKHWFKAEQDGKDGLIPKNYIQLKPHEYVY